MEKLFEFLNSLNTKDDSSLSSLDKLLDQLPPNERREIARWIWHSHKVKIVISLLTKAIIFIVVCVSLYYFINQLLNKNTTDTNSEQKRFANSKKYKYDIKQRIKDDSVKIELMRLSIDAKQYIRFYTLSDSLEILNDGKHEREFEHVYSDYKKLVDELRKTTKR